MNYTALIIEDEPLLARNMMLYLQRHELECQAAGSGEEGLMMVDEVRPDVVVLDHNLPGKTGLSVLEELRARDAQLPVVMVTGHGSEQVAVDAMKLGAFDYLIKPVSLHQLKQVLDRAVQQQRQASELRHLRAQSAGASATKGSAALLGSSSAMKQMRHRLAQLVDADRRLTQGAPAAVLIHGETGTGKELVARSLHFDGPRSEGPFVEINCASLPSQLVESELFGHERGAFTDAKERRIGLVEAADGGTLFLDEVGELELATQAKLLKLLEDRRVRRLGSVRDQEVDVRVVAATNRPLEAMVQAGTFRGDLFFRLGALRIDLPPLRAREGDVVELAKVFLARTARRYGKPDLRWSREALDALAAYAWPGNVRELSNVVEQSVILCASPEVGVSDLNLPAAPAVPPDARHGAAPAATTGFGGQASLPDAERQMLEQALTQHRWNVTQAARALGISRDTLRYRIDKYDLKPTA
ncbi:sigma-54 dependent transcriptional regulator [Hydrogenophaga sp. 5NK40-0174]|uniref:sigma-54-dependent transcriptional regulator n=1 Tax=Hydrogenophaga sp. 5NK40-0174 TaxID=3127649 RepID=UPI0031076313